jgi:hypothetical protein
MVPVPDPELTSDALRAIALDRGWRYRERDRALPSRWSGAPFDGWSAGQAMDVVSGPHREFPVLAFRYQQQPEVPIDGSAYLVAVAALPGPLPRMALVPQEDPVDPNPYGYDFEPEDALLATRYSICVEREELAGTLLHLDAVRRLREFRPVDWRVEGSDLLVVAPDVAGFDETEVAELLDALVDVAQGIPADLYHRYPPRPDQPLDPPPAARAPEDPRDPLPALPDYPPVQPWPGG